MNNPARRICWWQIARTPTAYSIHIAGWRWTRETSLPDQPYPGDGRNGGSPRGYTDTEF